MSRVKHNIADESAVNLFEETGQHCLLTGATGSGKTTQLYWLIRTFIEKNENMIFRDTGKGNESLYLRQFKELRYFVPEGCNIVCEDTSIDFEVCEFTSYEDIFKQIATDKINVLSVWRFLIDDVQLTDFWAFFFRELIHRALDYQLPIPLTVVVDELSQIAPSHVLTPTQDNLCRSITRSVEILRGVDVRLLGTSQGWTKLYKGVRISFQYYIFKRVAERVDIDMPVLKKTMNRIQSLRPDQFIILTPEKFYSNPYSRIPDLKVKDFCKQHTLRYKGRLDYDWKCESELRPEGANKYKVKYEDTQQRLQQERERTKKLAKYLYDLKIITQTDLAKMLELSQPTVSNWINESSETEEAS